MWVFTPPTQPRPFGDANDFLWGRFTYPEGITVGITASGAVKTYPITDAESNPDVVSWFQGGRVHEVDDATANVLTAAGYGPFLTAVPE